jgi:hypothetical protein
VVVVAAVKEKNLVEVMISLQAVDLELLLSPIQTLSQHQHQLVVD